MLGLGAESRPTSSYETARLSSTYTNNYQTDIDDQAATYGFGNENYAYDEVGNLIKDQSERIANIEWTVYGKVKKVQRNPLGTNESGQVSMDFGYDGNTFRF